jgi:RND family efflux transporter MFP subunit
MNTMRRIGRMTTGLALLAALGLGACGGPASGDAGGAMAPMVIGLENLAVAVETTLAEGPSISGQLVAEREARVRAELAGSVLETRAEPGQPVKAGQVLAAIDPTTAREAVLAARAQLRSAESTLALARRNLERSQRLLAAGAVSERTLEDDTRAVAQAEAGLADAQSRLASVGQTLAKATVRAPFAGIVSERSVSAGDVVQPGTALFTIVDPSSLRLDAAVPVDALGALKVGTSVEFTLNGLGAEAFTGRITRISPVVDPVSRQVKLAVTLPNPGHRLVAGLFAEGRVITNTRSGVTVPRAALDTRGVRPVAARLRGGVVERVEVTIGLEDPVTERVEVSAGLAPGDTLLLGGPAALPAGTPVRVQAAAERAPPGAAR